MAFITSPPSLKRPAGPGRAETPSPGHGGKTARLAWLLGFAVRNPSWEDQAASVVVTRGWEGRTIRSCRLQNAGMTDETWAQCTDDRLDIYT